MKSFLFAFVFVAMAQHSHAVSITSMDCELNNAEPSAPQLQVSLKMNQPLDVTDKAHVPLADGITAQILISLNGRVIVSDTALCAREPAMYSSEVRCNWGEPGVNDMISWFRAMPESVKQFTGIYFGDVFVSTYGEFGLDSRDARQGLSNYSLKCSAR